MKISLSLQIAIFFIGLSHITLGQNKNCTLIAEKGGFSYQITLTGELVNSTKYIDIGAYNQGFRSARKKSNNDTIAGYIDEYGNEFSFNFKNTFNYSEGYAVVQLMSGKYSLIDSNFNLVTKEEFDIVLDLEEGFSPVRKNGKWTFIDTQGKLLFQPLYDDLFWFENGFSSVKLNKLYGYINKKGKLISEIKFSHWRNFDKDGYAFVSDENLGWTVIDTLGNFIYKDKEYLIDGVYFNEFGQVSAYQKTADSKLKYGYVDKKGNITVPIKFDIIESFYYYPVTGAGIKLNNGFDKYYLIDTSGNKISQTEFDHIHYFYKGGVSMVTMKTFKSKPIDRTITIEDIELNYMDISGKMGAIDTLGNIVIPIIYSELSPIYSYEQDDFYKGQCLFSAKKETNGPAGVLNDKGAIIVPFNYQFSHIYYIGNGVFSLTTMTGKKILYDTKTQKEVELNNSEFSFIIRDACQTELMVFIDTKTSKVGVKNQNLDKWLIKPVYDKISVSNKDNNLWNLKK